MYWKIHFRVNRDVNSAFSIIKIEAQSLREACIEVLDTYRSAIIISSQLGSGPVRPFNSEEIGIQPNPINPEIFAINKRATQ